MEGWVLLVFLAVIVAVHWWEYRTSIQEYMFAQPATMDKHDDLRSLLAEKTPLAVEIGALPWRPEVATKSTWTVVSQGMEEAMPVAQWIGAKPAIQNGSALADEMELTTGLGDLDESRAWWWLPGMRAAQVGVLHDDEVSGLSWVGAERRWIGCTHGAGLTLWLVHSRYRRYLPFDDGTTNPWSLTVAEAPWIGRVQFVEVAVKPGWCIGIPAHWGVAVRSTNSEAGKEAWWWSAEQHSALSWCLHEVERFRLEATLGVPE
jgi:hypothetical protein